MNSIVTSLIDIGANLTDSSYEGIYFEKKAHESDLDLVVQRGREKGDFLS